MGYNSTVEELIGRIDNEEERGSDYFSFIKEIIVSDEFDDSEKHVLQEKIYQRILEEILNNSGRPVSTVKFGTSGWRGILGKDLFCRSVVQVTSAIVEMYKTLETDSAFAASLGVNSLQQAKERGCVVGFDNRFGGEKLAKAAVEVLNNEGFIVYYAEESTTGALSAAVLQLNAAFSINFTPSHNPLEYGGLKYNAADAGPAAVELTTFITHKANEFISVDFIPDYLSGVNFEDPINSSKVKKIDAFALWRELVRKNEERHGIEFDNLISRFTNTADIVVAIDCVHGASRLDVPRIFTRDAGDKVTFLRSEQDYTFGGVAPEPSSENMKEVVKFLKARTEKLKLGAIIDPDGDRIRFTDGEEEISMNQFGAMAYYFLHENKKKAGIVAKTVATSNFANAIAAKLGEKVFEPPVGFKEFKPVIGKALVCFEESDGISIIGHTPEKDAYIGLLVAMDMVLTTGMNLSEYKQFLEVQYGGFYPDRDGIEVKVKGRELLDILGRLEKYAVGSKVQVGNDKKVIKDVLDIDGRKMIFEDDSWLMIRPSGTEPKVRFYVEARTSSGSGDLVSSAKEMLREIGLL